MKSSQHRSQKRDSLLPLSMPSGPAIPAASQKPALKAPHPWPLPLLLPQLAGGQFFPEGEDMDEDMERVAQEVQTAQHKTASHQTIDTLTLGPLVCVCVCVRMRTRWTTRMEKTSKK